MTTAGEFDIIPPCIVSGVVRLIVRMKRRAGRCKPGDI